MIIIDSITNYSDIGSNEEVKILMTRLIDYMKSCSITALYTSLTSAGEIIDTTSVGISSLMDSWIALRDIEYNGERTDFLSLKIKNLNRGKSNGKKNNKD